MVSLTGGQKVFPGISAIFFGGNGDTATKSSNFLLYNLFFASSALSQADAAKIRNGELKVAGGDIAMFKSFNDEFDLYDRSLGSMGLNNKSEPRDDRGRRLDGDDDRWDGRSDDDEREEYSDENEGEPDKRSDNDHVRLVYTDLYDQTCRCSDSKGPFLIVSKPQREGQFENLTLTNSAQFTVSAWVRVDDSMLTSRDG